MKIMKALTLAALAMGLLTVPATAQTSNRHDVDAVSKALLEPINARELRRHMDAVFIRRQSKSVYAVGPNATRVWYTYSIQLPDGSLMQLPETYDVTQVGEHAQRGIYNDLTLYSVRKAGARRDMAQVGVTTDGKVILLDDDKGSN